MARNAVGALREFTGRARSFARRVLRSCRGNLEDVNRGDLFNQFCAQHEVTPEEFEISEEQPATQVDTQWLQNLLGSDYGSYVPEPPIFQTQSQVLSQTGAWEHGQTSGGGGDAPESSTAALRRTRTARERRPPDAYTPGSVGGRGRGRARRSHS